jgi:hypothetical protein
VFASLSLERCHQDGCQTTKRTTPNKAFHPPPKNYQPLRPPPEAFKFEYTFSCNHSSNHENHDWTLRFCGFSPMEYFLTLLHLVGVLAGVVWSVCFGFPSIYLSVLSKVMIEQSKECSIRQMWSIVLIQAWQGRNLCEKVWAANATVTSYRLALWWYAQDE